MFAGVTEETGRRGGARAPGSAGGSSRLRCFFLFNFDMEYELACYRRGEAAAHRLIGLADCERLGHEAVRCPAPPRWAGSSGLWFRLFQTVWGVLRQRRIDFAIATHEAAALPVLLARRLGLFRRPVVVLALSLLHPRECAGWRGWLWRRLLPRADAVVAVTRAQIPWLAEEYGVDPRRIHFVPVGVDTAFFAEQGDGTAAAEPGTCLAAGTQSGRDLATLVRAAPAGCTVRLLVTPELAAQVSGLAPAGVRVEVLAPVPMVRLREHYRRAAVHVVPLVRTRYGSGHTVLVENMAMGKVVVVTDVPTVRDYVTEGETAILVPEGDVGRLRDVLARVLAEPGAFAHLGRAAARVARERLDSAAVTDQWMQIGRRLTGRRDVGR
ncbi:MAG TPA: glycosyltransferase [Tepidisphaeraceae bacterium]|nr:glycosyltransferase [Tepidisphaeraceae bacterium]